MSSTTLVALGVDAGGTTTRAVVADATGTVLGRATGPGGNRWSSTEPGPATVASVAAGALETAGLPAVAAAVVGVAGWGDQGALIAALADLLPHEATVLAVPDVVVNHAAGSARADGLVLAAGTGAIGARIADDRIVRRADGCGWLLGDEGSAVWLGLEGLRATLRALDGRGPDTALVGHAVAQLLPDASTDAPAEELRAGLVDAGLSAEPAAFGRLAPGIVAAAGGGDAVATDIVALAATRLATTLRTVTADAPAEHVVLAGSLLLTADALRREVVAAIGRDHPSATVTAGHDGGAGAAAIALRRATGQPLAAPVHSRLCAPTSLPV